MIQIPKEVVDSIVSHIRLECDSAGIAFETGPKGTIKIHGISCNGYFDDKIKKLAFWTDEHDLSWLPIALHEYGHFLQWKLKRNFWIAKTYFKDRTDEVLDCWFNGEEFSPEDVTLMINNAIEVEFDNEIQTVDLVRHFKVEKYFPISEYIQKANAYVLFYHIVKKYRQFYPMGQEPYNIEQIWKQMPVDYNHDPLNPKPELIALLDNFYAPLMKKG